jgi:hypothetical protein
MSFFSKKTKITIHAFTRLVAQCIIKANPINCQLIEESEYLSSKEKENVISELLYFRLALLYFMLVFKGTFGSRNYDESELIDILIDGVCLAFEDNGIDKENAQKRTEIFRDKLQYYNELVIGTGEDPIEIEASETYYNLVQRFRDDMLGVDGDKLAERVEDEEYMTKHHEVFHFVKQVYDLDENNFNSNLKGFKFID